MAGVEAKMTAPPEAAWDVYELIQAFLQAPSYHLIFEVLLIIWIVQMYFMKSYKPKRTQLTEKEKDDLIESWQPEPLVPDTPADHPLLLSMNNRTLESKVDKIVTINGKECLNVASLNFLCMTAKPKIEEAALKALRKYGVGSCGPRGFYGTVDVHLELEERLAAMMEVEEAIVYSYGFSTISSAIPAYSKRGDIIFCDAGVNFSIQQGVLASRSIVRYFKHNDMADLERLLLEQEEVDKKMGENERFFKDYPKKAKATRRFLIVEGLYIRYGDLCPLPKLVELKDRFKLRIFMDESLSFATIGATGKGVTEFYDISVDEIDLITGSLEHSVASVGGFCCGRSFVIDHQRLSGLGYCFSASTPPLLSQAAITALDIIHSSPELLERLSENAKYMHNLLKNISGMTLVGSPESPVQILELKEKSTVREDDMQVLRSIVVKAEQKGVVLTIAAYLDQEKFLPPPSLRVAVNCEMTEAEMDKVLSVIQDCAKEEML